MPAVFAGSGTWDWYAGLNLVRVASVDHVCRFYWSFCPCHVRARMAAEIRGEADQDPGARRPFFKHMLNGGG